MWCEKCNDEKRFIYERTSEGTLYKCTNCGFEVHDLAKYPYARYFPKPI